MADRASGYFTNQSKHMVLIVWFRIQGYAHTIPDRFGLVWKSSRHNVNNAQGNRTRLDRSGVELFTPYQTDSWFVWQKQPNLQSKSVITRFHSKKGTNRLSSCPIRNGSVLNIKPIIIDPVKCVHGLIDVESINLLWVLNYNTHSSLANPCYWDCQSS